MSKKKILIVDDEKDILNTFRMLVERIGYQAVTASDGAEAIQILKRESFDLVLLDILMPKISGIDVIKWIRSTPQIQTLKVIFVSAVDLGETGEDILEKYKPAGYINKPMDIAVLKKKLKEVL